MSDLDRLHPPHVAAELQRIEQKAGTTWRWDARSPQGHQIIGTVELIPGTARCGDFTPGEQPGTVDFEYEGETDIDWDGQYSRYVDTGRYKGQRLFEAADGSIVREGKLILVAICTECETDLTRPPKRLGQPTAHKTYCPSCQEVVR